MVGWAEIPMSESTGEPTRAGGSRRSSRFAGLHARTYEMELLLSGAVVLGLIHLPPAVRRAFDTFTADLAGGSRLLALFAQAYVELALYALIAAFVFHLAARGWWIALLGLESVFPDGIRWEKAAAGRFMLERYRRGIGTLADAVDRADDLCSLVFSFAVLIVSTWVYSMVLLALAAGLAFSASRLLLGGEGAVAVLVAFLGAVLGIQLLVGPLDKALGEKVRPDGVVGRLLRLLVGVAWALSPTRWVGAIQLTLGTNISGSRIAAVVLGATVALAAVQTGGTVLRAGNARMDSLSWFPDALYEHGVDPGHYRALRDPAALDPLAPSIQSDVVADPYVTLFLPYSPRIHNPLIAKACPELRPISSEGLALGRASSPTDAEVRTAAACLGGLYALTLDGAPLADPGFEFTVDPGTGGKGLVLYLPARDLAPGRHELAVLAPTKHTADSGERKRHVIPFRR